MSADIDVAVIGAGIAGLTAAHGLRKAGCSVSVFEASDHVGGRMATVRVDGYRVDTGAEQIPRFGYAATWNLLAELGIDRSRVPLIGGQLAMWRAGRAHTGVMHPRGLLTGAGLSPKARLDFVRLAVRAARGALVGTVKDVAARYHRDLLDYLLAPVASGFFGWDPARSAASPFLGLAMAVGPTNTWRVYAEGMDTLARALADRLDIIASSPVREVVAGNSSVRIVSDVGEFTARAVVLGVPAPVAREIHANPPSDDLPYLAASSYTPIVKVSFHLDRPLAPVADQPVYALLVPSVEGDTVSTIMIDHVKHLERVPVGRGLITAMASPAIVGELLDAPDDEVISRMTDAVERYVPGLGEATTRALVHRFRYGLPEAMPQALALRADFLARRAGVVDYAGDWVPASPCSEAAVRSGHRAAARVLSAWGKELV